MRVKITVKLKYCNFTNKTHSKVIHTTILAHFIHYLSKVKEKVLTLPDQKFTHNWSDQD